MKIADGNRHYVALQLRRVIAFDSLSRGLDIYPVSGLVNGVCKIKQTSCFTYKHSVQQALARL